MSNGHEWAGLHLGLVLAAAEVLLTAVVDIPIALAIVVRLRSVNPGRTSKGTRARLVTCHGEPALLPHLWRLRRMQQWQARSENSDAV